MNKLEHSPREFAVSTSSRAHHARPNNVQQQTRHCSRKQHERTATLQLETDSMADNQTFVFVKWSDKADIIQVDYHPSPARVSHLRDAFKAKHLAASTISTTAIHVSDAINGHELDAFDELGDLGNSRNNALHISVDHAPIYPDG